MITGWAAAAMSALLALPSATAQEVAQGSGAQLRALDRLSGETVDLDVAVGEAAVYEGRLEIRLLECRYPADNPDGDAFARLQIRATDGETPLFEGWMIASSPALNALDHMRYDVWVLRCNRT